MNAPASISQPQGAAFIDGVRRFEGAEHNIINPARFAQVVGTTRYSTLAMVDEAVAGSARAGRCWAATSLADRTAALRAAVVAMTAQVTSDDLAVLLTREQGKILPESTSEVATPAALVGLFAGLAERALVEERLDDERGSRITGYVPIGPVAIVTPWNWPVALSMTKVIPALLAGNTVTLKPAPNTPLTIGHMIEAMAAALPPGVLNLVQGEGDIGAALVSHPAIRKVVFTGSTASGKKVFASCAPGIRNMALELGGNDAAVLLDDVVLDDAMLQLLARSAFITAGQVCWAIKRVYAPASRYREVVDALAALADRFVVGDGLDPTVTMGPLNNAMQLGVVRNLVQEARDAGGQVIECGSFAAGLDPEAGYFHRPAIVTGLTDDASLVREEQFGPTLPVIAYDNLETGIARINESEYGLNASVWTADADRGFDVARTLEAGQVFVNCHAGPALDYSMPFGGAKQSGFGRELGVAGVREFTEHKLYSNRIVR